MLVDYKCKTCGSVYEEFFFQNEPRPSFIQCECGAQAIYIFPVVAKTVGYWGNSHSYFDRGLGMVVENSHHRDAIIKEKEVVPLSDSDLMQQNYLMEKSLVEARDHEKVYGTPESVERLTQAINNFKE